MKITDLSKLPDVIRIKNEEGHIYRSELTADNSTHIKYIVYEDDWDWQVNVTLTSPNVIKTDYYSNYSETGGDVESNIRVNSYRQIVEKIKEAFLAGW